jgi:matrixin
MRETRNYGLMKRSAASLAAVLLLVQPVFAGGPLTVGGPGAGLPGVPLLWDDSKAIVYRVDAGPLSQRPNGGAVVIDNASGIARVNGMFGNWAAVSTANLSFNNAGGLLAIANAGFPSGGDVQTAQQFMAVVGDTSGQMAPDLNSCNGGGQSPIVFDADGSIFGALGLPSEVIGFAFTCDYDATTGRIISAGAILNGRFQDGINDPNSGNLELTTDEFNQAFTHEFGHFLGLGHSQINVDLLLKAVNNQSYACTSDDTAGMPLMFPILGICPAKVTSKVPIIAVDDAAWISKLYPVGSSPPPGKTSYNGAYGTISGNVLFSDGTTPVQGVNVIARNTNAPRRNAASAVSGYLFTGNPGQTTTCIDPAHPSAATCSNLGDPFGSRDASLIGHYDIPLPPGTYSISVESVYAGFTGGSSLTPLDPPIPMPGTYSSSATVTVKAGAATSLGITLQGTPSRFDAFESAAMNGQSQLRWLRRKQFCLELA